MSALDDVCLHYGLQKEAIGLLDIERRVVNSKAVQEAPHKLEEFAARMRAKALAAKPSAIPTSLSAPSSIGVKYERAAAAAQAAVNGKAYNDLLRRHGVSGAAEHHALSPVYLRAQGNVVKSRKAYADHLQASDLFKRDNEIRAQIHAIKERNAQTAYEELIARHHAASKAFRAEYGPKVVAKPEVPTLTTAYRR